jgi:hypothetical protein
MSNHKRRAALVAAVFAAGALGGVLACGGITVDNPPPSLTLTVLGSGSGRISSNDGKINCKVTASVASGPSCIATYDSGKVVTITAAPDADQDFKAWSGGDCNAGTSSCQLSITRNITASATFVRAVETMTLELVTPNSDDGAAIIRIDGPSVLGVAATAGLELVSRPTGTTPVTSRTILLRGNLTSAVVAQVSIRGVDAGSPSYTATVVSVAGRQSAGYVQRQNLAAYRANMKQ